MIDLGQIQALAQPAMACSLPVGRRFIQLLRGGAQGHSVCRRAPVHLKYLT